MNLKQTLKKQLRENIETLDNLNVELSIFELLKDKETAGRVSKVRDILHEQKLELDEINL